MHPLKNVKRICIALLLSLIFSLVHGQDTLVKKRYIDSLKNQIASYKVTSYMHLNMYDKSQEEYRKLASKYQVGQTQFTYFMERRRKENIQYGIATVFLCILFMVGIISFTK